VLCLQRQEDVKTDLETLGTVLYGQFMEHGQRFQAVKNEQENRLWLVFASALWQ